MERVRRSILAALIIGVLLLGACGSSTTPSDIENQPTTSTTATSTSTSKLFCKVILVTSSVMRGRDITVAAQATPGARCSIKIYNDDNQQMKSKSLSAKTTDDHGNVWWKFTVSTKTAIGLWRVIVTASLDGETASGNGAFIVE